MANTELDEKVLRLIKQADLITREATLALMKAGIAGKPILEQLEAANAVLIAAGRDPIPEDAFLADIEKIAKEGVP